MVAFLHDNVLDNGLDYLDAALTARARCCTFAAAR